MENEIRIEKLCTPAGKQHEDKGFRDLMEIARSLIPKDSILSHTFPINCLIGLTRNVASSILKQYHESVGIVKTAAFYKKRDPVFFVHHIYVILDKLYSKHAIANPPSSETEGDFDDDEYNEDKLITQPLQDVTRLPIVTPNPPSPKKRKTYDIVPLRLEMGFEFATTLTEQLTSITWDEIHNMDFKTVQQYLTAYTIVENCTLSATFSTVHY